MDEPERSEEAAVTRADVPAGPDSRPGSHGGATGGADRDTQTQDGLAEDGLAEDGLESQAPEGPDEAGTALPPKVEAWRRRSAAGAILTGFALGLQQALETQRDEPSIVVQTSGDPPDDLPVEAEFEYGRPRQSVVSIRPWLLQERDPDGSSDES